MKPTRFLQIFQTCNISEECRHRISANLFWAGIVTATIIIQTLLMGLPSKQTMIKRVERLGIRRRSRRCCLLNTPLIIHLSKHRNITPFCDAETFWPCNMQLMLGRYLISAKLHLIWCCGILTRTIALDTVLNSLLVICSGLPWYIAKAV